MTIILCKETLFTLKNKLSSGSVMKSIACVIHRTAETSGVYASFAKLQMTNYFPCVRKTTD